MTDPTLSALAREYLHGHTDGLFPGVYAEHPRRCAASKTTHALNQEHALREMLDTVIDLPPDEPDTASGGRATRTSPRAAVPGARHLADLTAAEFGPADLRAVQRHMIDSGRLCRRMINERINRIRQFFGHLVSYDRCPLEVHQRLGLVKPVRATTPGVCEAKRRVSVPLEHVARTVEVARPIVGRAIGVHMLTGMRPAELVSMRIRELRLAGGGELWEYRPAWDKTRAHRTAGKIIPIGPEAQMLLREVITWQHAQGRLSDGQVILPRLGDPDDDRHVWPWATVGGYRQAVTRAVKRASVPHWSPGQLRKNAATLAYAEGGTAMAAQLLGHTNEQTVQRHYIDPDDAKARQFALDFG